MRSTNRTTAPHAQCLLPRCVTGILPVFIALLALGCINNRSERGVEPVWFDAGQDAFIIGTTTRSEVLAMLGAPSQLVSLESETALFYVLETTVGKGLILFLYNQRKDVTNYARAVFFFDEDDVLTDFALSERQ